MARKPSSEEIRKNLNVCSWAVDYIITHSPPSSFARRLIRPQNELTGFPEEACQKGGIAAGCSTAAMRTRQLTK